MKSVGVLVALCMLALAATHASAAAVSCNDVENNLKACIPHLKSSQGSQATPPASCCSGVKAVKALADSTSNHKAVCQCMQAAATRTPGLNFNLAAKLPNQCGVVMSYTFSPNTDCSKL